MQVHTLDLNFRGLTHNTAAYLVQGPHGALLIESGPRSTLETLLAALAAHGVEPQSIRDVLVTHIHLDHSGAAGWWAQQGARIHVHPKGARHLVDPAKLIASAERIYGDRMLDLWGEILPIDAQLVLPCEDHAVLQLAGLEIEVLATPGHASHHNAYRIGQLLFCGDVAGVRTPGTALQSLPAPPPEFDVEAWQVSLARLMQMDLQCLYLTHFGAITDVRAHLEQLASLVISAADFVRGRLTAGIGREALLAEYIAWNRERALATGLEDEDWQRFEAANPIYMSVDGITRYWTKKWEVK